MNSQFYDYRSSPRSPTFRPQSRLHRPSTSTGITHNRQRSDPQRALHLQLPSLPRFHPANYNASNLGNSSSNFLSQAPSLVTSPASASSSPQPSRPASSGSNFHASLSDAQKQLYHYQREMISLNRLSRSPSIRSHPSPREPGSPLLNPLGSPGPITPLELEHEERSEEKAAGYFLVGSSPHAILDETAKDEILEAYIHKETARTRNQPSSPRKTTYEGQLSKQNPTQYWGIQQGGDHP